MTHRIALWSESIADELTRQAGQHTVRFPFATVSYWEKGSAALAFGFWDRAVITCRSQFPQFEIVVKDPASTPDLAARSRELTTILGLLHAAYEQGGSDRSRDFRLLLDAASR